MGEGSELQQKYADEKAEVDAYIKALTEQKLKVMFDVQEIRSQFPILQEKVNGKDLVYLDNAATSQKPKMVLDAINNYYEHYNANVHRGIHTLSQVATEMMEDARKKVQHFINAEHDYEVLLLKVQQKV